MTHAIPNPQKIRADQEELQRLRDLRERLDTETSDPETRAVLDEWAEEQGVHSDSLTLEDIRAGRYTADELADRMPEVQRLLDPTHREADGDDIRADDIRAMSAEEIAAFGADKALEIVNAEGDR